MEKMRQWLRDYSRAWPKDGSGATHVSMGADISFTANAMMVGAGI